MENPTTITVLGGVLAALVIAFFTYWAGDVQKKQSDAEKAVLNDTINKKNSKISELTNETLNNLKSKDSYCFMDIIVHPNKTLPDGSCMAALFLRHEGKYPIKNVRISLINTDDEADDENINGTNRNNDPVKYFKSSHPFTELIPILLPNQSLRLRDINVIIKSQKSFNIFFSADHNIWFQRVLIRNFSPSAEQHYFSPFISQVYLQNLDPTLNQVHIFETIVREESSLNRDNGFLPNKGKFNRRNWGSFPSTESEKQGKLWRWQKLHWNGYYLENGDNLILSKYLND